MSCQIANVAPDRDCTAPATHTFYDVALGHVALCSPHLAETLEGGGRYDVVDLPPGWSFQADPDIAGGHVAINMDRDGRTLVLALLEEGRPEVSVLCPARVYPTEIDGECLGTFPDLDEALEFANKLMELEA